MTESKFSPSNPARHSRGQGLSEAFVLLDNSSGSGPPSLLFREPVEIVTAHSAEDVPAAISRLEAALSDGLHAAGFFSYELGYVLEPRIASLQPASNPVPLMWFGLYRAPEAMSNEDVATWLADIARSESHEFSDVTLAWDEDAYLERFDKVIEYIRAGDIYQLNLTFKARFQLCGSPLTFYKDLRAKQRVLYGGIVDTGEVTILSASPELFISKRGDVIETRPMKGTAPRAGAIQDDDEQRRILATDVKQRAENLMIVDLMRNDIGRIAELGSVEVTDLFTVETFRTLHQMTSGVRAKLTPGLSLLDLIKGIFPPGSITGAPKIRAMELIAQLESEARGVYCGTIGHLAPTGEAQFNVAIRTPMIGRDGRGEMGIGSGVVYDSQGAKEYAECLLKMKFLTDPPKPFELIETMLWKPDTGFWLLERHFDRLAASAEYFAFKYDKDAAKSALDEAVVKARQSSSQANGVEALRVRLTLAEDGAVAVTTTEIPAPREDAVMRYAVSQSVLDRRNPFLFHKTTRRELYDQEWASFSETHGADEVIYFNDDGHLCEGSRTNVFLERDDGVLVTPPLADGLLPGTLRAELLAQGRAVEGTVTREDLRRAERGEVQLFLGNSVRGLVRADCVSSQSPGSASK